MRLCLLRLLYATVLVAIALPASARAAETAKLDVHFAPDILGGNTTILTDFTIGTPNGQIPSPLIDVDLRLPPGVSLGSSTLGLATCTSHQLEVAGLAGCSANAVMGGGTALVEVPLGPVIVPEPVKIAILMGQAMNQHTSLLFYADGRTPVSAQLVFPGLLLEGTSGNFAAELNTEIPLTPSVPGAADAAVVQMNSLLGPKELVYHKSSHGKIVHYRPVGIAIPRVCPAGGFRFAARLTFQDGSKLTTTSVVPCPHHSGGHHVAASH